MVIFAKLGGSLITDKNKPFTVRKDVLSRLAGEFALARQADPGLSLVIGHGSGSFGHMAAREYGPRNRPKTVDQWHGFQEVWQAAHQLDQIVLDAFQAEGLPVVAFSPSASVLAKGCRILSWDIRPIRATLKSGLIPLVFGDAVIDDELGWTILSTEDLFVHLAPLLNPERILLAGVEEGVWLDYSKKDHLIPLISPEESRTSFDWIGASRAVDVTGGMADKVNQMMALIVEVKSIQVSIFSGLVERQLLRALGGEFPGTTIGN